LTSFIFIDDMPTFITINNITGSTPFDVYTCDSTYTTCVYISTITSSNIPYQFQLPFIQEGMTPIGVKVIDNNGCIIEENISL
jgi:hypothetical protein